MPQIWNREKQDFDYEDWGEGERFNPLIERLSELYRECAEIVQKKNADYANDGDPFKNFNGSIKYGVPVPKGMLVRMEDKMQRIGNLLDRPAMDKESIYDTCSDLANYALILRVWLEMHDWA